MALQDEYMVFSSEIGFVWGKKCPNIFKGRSFFKYFFMGLKAKK